MCLGLVGAIESVWDEGGVPMGSMNGNAVCLVYAPDAVVGDIVLTHSGFVVEMLDAEQASTALGLRTRLVSLDTGKEPS